MSRLFGYVYKPGTPQEKRVMQDTRQYRSDEMTYSVIKQTGLNPRDFWFFDEKIGITGPYFSPGDRPTEEELTEMKKLAEKWNHRYNFGMKGDAPEYSAVSPIYNHYGEEYRTYCMCVGDHDSPWYVSCMSFPLKEVDEYCKKRISSGEKIDYDQAKSEFFNERCPYHKFHGEGKRFANNPNAYKGVKKNPKGTTSQYGYHFNYTSSDSSWERTIHHIYATYETVEKDYEVATQKGYKCEIIKCLGEKCRQTDCRFVK